MKRSFKGFISISVSISALAILTLNSCRHSDVISGADMRTVYFDKEILPIFVNQCGSAGCHGANSERRNYTTYNGIIIGIIPGQPYNSKIYSAIIGVYLNKMPPKGSITENQRILIKVWIEQGAKNNVFPDTVKKTDTTKVAVDTTKLVDTTNVSFSKQIFPIVAKSCAISGCHDGSSSSISSFRTYELLMKDIIANNSAQSKFYQRLNGISGNKMPMGSSLSPNQIKLIRLWIDQGAKKDTGTLVNLPPVVTVPKVDLGYACFSRDIFPIIQANCEKCHSQLSSYNAIMNNLVESPGDPANTTLYYVITANGENAMPVGYKLPQANIDSIYSWIKHGATNNTCVSNCDTINYNFTAQVMPIINNNCIGCHSGTAPQGNVSLVNYASITTVVNNGKLLNSLNKKTMPPLSPLTDCSATVIKKWINAGAKNN